MPQQSIKAYMRDVNSRSLKSYSQNALVRAIVDNFVHQEFLAIRYHNWVEPERAPHWSVVDV